MIMSSLQSETRGKTAIFCCCLDLYGVPIVKTKTQCHVNIGFDLLFWLYIKPTTNRMKI